jgi:hypothetical protein
MNILDFARDGNADEVYAKIREAEEFNLIIADELVQIADDYEGGKYNDPDFCEKVINHFLSKTFAVVLIAKEDPKEPTIEVMNAVSEGDAYGQFAKRIGYNIKELAEGEEEGEITIHIKEVKIN